MLIIIIGCDLLGAKFTFTLLIQTGENYADRGLGFKVDNILWQFKAGLCCKWDPNRWEQYWNRIEIWLVYYVSKCEYDICNSYALVPRLCSTLHASWWSQHLRMCIIFGLKSLNNGKLFNYARLRSAAIGLFVDWLTCKTLMHLPSVDSVRIVVTKIVAALPVKRRTRKVKRFACKQCGEKFKYRYQLTRHELRSHKQSSGDTATSTKVPAAGEGEIECSLF